jgi:hypothetical protein
MSSIEEARAYSFLSKAKLYIDYLKSKAQDIVKRKTLDPKQVLCLRDVFRKSCLRLDPLYFVTGLISEQMWFEALNIQQIDVATTRDPCCEPLSLRFPLDQIFTYLKDSHRLEAVRGVFIYKEK